MIQGLILGICLLVGVVLLLNWFAKADPRAMARLAKYGGMALGIGVILFLTITGRLPALVGALGALLPFLLNLRRVADRLKSMAGPSPGQKSGLDTAWLHVELDHDTGRMGGAVRQGSFAGRTLDDLTVEELIRLRGECAADDPQSVAIVEAFLDRTHGAEWREAAGEEAAEGGPGAGTGAGGGTGGPSGGRMTKAEAYRVLGLEPGADTAAIKQAHRRLMKKFHPDQGGSDYFAAKLNEAKDILLGS
ncbi:MAG: DnaJ domain-containing protein [Alphaproteobacteria bacterium]|jgi:hypothetical protein|nr:DnaJ domain-containing protein [Alphaproteobacteria bacterium]